MTPVPDNAILDETNPLAEMLSLKNVMENFLLFLYFFSLFFVFFSFSFPLFSPNFNVVFCYFFLLFLFCLCF